MTLRRFPGRRIIWRLGLSLMLTCWAASLLPAAPPQTPATTPAPPAPVPKTAANPTVQNLTLKDMLDMLDWTFWPFVLVTLAGFTTLIWRALSDYQDRVRGRQLLAQTISLSSLNQFGSLVSAVQPSRAARLFKHMIMTFNKTNQAESLAGEVNTYLADDRTSYETFNRVMTYLSDTAGALGLLGTVWGIFVTFYGGTLDSTTILNGMGVALITTLVGLILSLLFNLGTTALNAGYGAHLKVIGDKAEELRQALLALQRSRNNIRKNFSARPVFSRGEEMAASTAPLQEHGNGRGY
ncbi:MAG: MotA/TolQ/ExbB proton channel family protein [candidate division KSB1 bacterium]|nr:MotA/TolQ/ExbB proton channel family protein [candidate division KSB1 bacterium]MDZ7273941.1 MotA/TolQ/ExbB proton channel family protein [candidate division KSB1 bacterium]MDZ7286097.1 MotA/TolQ/ExbB proton channel family protein [candidate division KSB1 bacterium]MDZ7299129.1 MotA/TolQ/ExbB proton channel family protein [candidate division KSB1 bacterium]MDZ7306676.1 MotA/TolQ/ExbB proton channel family protein [candidate division KSB1 bacterium]